MNSEDDDKRFLSLGAGVQSTALAFMVENGDLPHVDAAIFADTGAEPTHVYEYLDWLETQLSFPVRRVMHKDGLLKNIRESVKGGRFASAPFFTKNKNGGVGMLRRQCTKEFKLSPILQGIRAELGLKKRERYRGGPVFQIIGISLDEHQRMTSNPLAPWLVNRYPLVEAKMTREDCLEYLKNLGVERLPSKSACTFCPYHDAKTWSQIKQDDQQWRQVVELDNLIRKGVRGTSEPLYLHRSCQPIENINFDALVEEQDAKDRDAKRQGYFPWWQDMQDECDGICGL